MGAYSRVGSSGGKTGMAAGGAAPPTTLLLSLSPSPLPESAESGFESESAESGFESIALMSVSSVK